VLQTIDLDRGCFACMLGGAEGTTLFLMAAEWRGTANMHDATRTGQVLTVQAPAPHVGWP
jgi:sugar lactone lactonase YvrE